LPIDQAYTGIVAYTTASTGVGQARPGRASTARTPAAAVPSRSQVRRRRSFARWWRRTRRNHRNAAENAAAVRDVFMDVVVIMSVIVFIALAAGIGLLAIQPLTLW
jgi:hypothetical protein